MVGSYNTTFLLAFQTIFCLQLNQIFCKDIKNNGGLAKNVSKTISVLA